VGEYAAIVGGSALTIPFRQFSARIRSVQDIPTGKEKEVQRSLENIKYLYDYIQSIPATSFHAPPDLDRFSENLHTYWLDHNIPIGYGLGSSGAVSAAIYDLFFPGSDTLTLQQQKEDLAVIESCFHGKSSGVDALTCHAGAALRFYPSGSIEKVQINFTKIPGDYRFFLLNSGKRFDTGPLVAHFLEQMKDPVFNRSMEEEYLPLNQLLIETLLNEREADPAMLVKLLSDFQLQFFRKMIPDHAIDLWIEGQVSNEYYLKLNGSGGGFMLGITHQSCKEGLDERWGEDLLWIDQIKTYQIG
jgi:mevalonate kinase